MCRPAAWRQVQGLQGVVAGQRGAFSPFLFGLMTAMAVFSAIAMQWAKRDLERMGERQAEQQRMEAEDLTKAVEFAMRTEDKGSFSQDFDRDRLLKHSAQSQGKTLGGNTVAIVNKSGDKTFDLTAAQIAITASDDTLTRAALLRQSADDLNRAASTNNAVAFVDTSAIRQQQVMQTEKNLEMMAALIYDFYAGQLRMPTPNEYDELTKPLNAADVWGEPFVYSYLNENEATLEFTTPWNYTRTLKVGLNE